MLDILYLGDNNPNSTSFHRANALSRLGNNVNVWDPFQDLGFQFNNSLLNRIHYHTGYRLIQHSLIALIKKMIVESKKIDIIWVNGGEFLGKECLFLLKSYYQCPIVLYTNDDPTGYRDGNRFDTLKKAIPYYDLCNVVRDVNIKEFKILGAKHVMRTTMSYDEVAHQPLQKWEVISDKYKSEIVFIGTWMKNENRDQLLYKLIEHKLSVSIWGDRWQKSKYWKYLKPFYKGKSLGGKDYVEAIQGAKICLGFLSKGNRDLHTQRTFEIPYAGGVLCAERTIEHEQLYTDGTEAVFWSNPLECINLCKYLLLNESIREEIRLAGMERVRNLNVGNESVCNQILKEALSNSIHNKL